MRRAGAAPKGRTLATDVFERLRADILECRLRPGTKLRFDEMRLAYGVGLTPLREALMRLASEGLLVLEDQRGFHVAPVSKSDLLDVTQMRQELEAMALRLSIQHGDDRWEADLIAALHHLSKLRRQDAVDAQIVGREWEERHRHFHRALVAACGSPWLLRFRTRLYEQADRYRRLSVQYLTRPRDELSEHRAITEAALARDADRACALIRRHIADTTEILLSAEPPIFVD